MIVRNALSLPPALHGGVIAMPEFASERSDAAALCDHGAMGVHVRDVRLERTDVKNVDCVRVYPDNSDMRTFTTGQLLLQLKARAGDPPLEEIAKLAGYKTKSGVQTFFNVNYTRLLDTNVAMKLADALEGKGKPPVRREELFALTGLPSRGVSLNDLPDEPPTVKSEDGSIPLRHVDMSLSMGDGTNIDDYFEEGVFEFDASLLRSISRSPAHRLIVGRGIGDSMTPTIGDDSLVIFDTTQTMLNSTDRIWAISLFGAGGIKRLRPVARDRVLVISDNPTVPDQEVSTEDLRILGRVIWSARRH
jgi:phage repressor protein C with HTH and peptisase S24 domain